MIYLRKYNEELKPSTYFTAANKLKTRGHNRRASVIEEWGKKVLSNEEYSKLLTNRELFKEFGEFELDMKNIRDDLSIGKFNMYLFFNEEIFKQSIDSSRGDSFSLAFEVNLIPADDETLSKLVGTIPYIGRIDNPFYNGYSLYFLSLYLNFKIQPGKLDLLGVVLDQEYKTFNSNRRLAVILKRSLMACFDDVPYRDLFYGDGSKSVYDKIIKIVCSSEDITLDFGVNMEDFYKCVSKIQINDLYND